MHDTSHLVSVIRACAVLRHHQHAPTDVCANGKSVTRWRVQQLLVDRSRNAQLVAACFRGALRTLGPAALGSRGTIKPSNAFHHRLRRPPGPSLLEKCSTPDIKARARSLLDTVVLESASIEAARGRLRRHGQCARTTNLFFSYAWMALPPTRVCLRSA